MKSLYDKLLEARCEMDSHESDLYVRDSERARQIINADGASYSYFTAQGTSERWIEVPFHYTPWWERRIPRAS